jgi:flagellar FliL protein
VFGLFLLMLSPALLAAEDDAAGVSPGYIPLGKPMILNLATEDNRLTFLQVTGDVLIKDESNKDEVEIHVPAIRHELILLLSEQDADDMKSPIKREEVRKRATQKVKARIEELVGSDEVAEVLFSTFLVQ